MHLMFSLPVLGSVLALAASPSLLATPSNGEAVQVGGAAKSSFACRVERKSIVPLVGPGSELTPHDVVLGVDRGRLHFRYGLVWETRKHQELGASVAAWSQGDVTPAYLHVSGRTLSFRSGGHESFVVFLPAGENQTVRAQVDVAPNGSAKLNARSLALVPKRPLK